MPDKFIVPQFIDNEDQILGPITVRQFLLMLVGTFVIFIAYTLLHAVNIYLFIFVTAVIVAFVAVFGFVKINGQPFHIFFVNFLQTSLRPNLRVWDKRPIDAELRSYMSLGMITALPKVSNIKARPESSRLRDLTLVVNTGGVYRPDEENF